MQNFDEKENEKRIFKVKEGIQLIFSHFEGRQQLFPRKMTTAFSNNCQFTVYTFDQILNECIKANFLDCRINAYPDLFYSTIPTHAPNIIFIDIDLRKDLHHDKALKKLDTSKNNTIKTIKEKLDGCSPTILWTGNGYHIYIVLETRPLELIKELKELSKEPSKEFLKFAEVNFSNNKSDPNHNPSFQSLLLRIPFTFNSKCIRQDNDSEVIIIQRFNSSKISQVNLPFLREFRLYLADKDLENKRETIRRQNKIYNQQPVKDTRGPLNHWIETLLNTPLKDNRKFCLWKIFVPYLLNIRKLTAAESTEILIEWLNACNDLEKLDFEPRTKIHSIVIGNKGYKPISYSRLQKENKILYDILVTNLT